MKLGYCLVAMASGALLATQGRINSQFGQHLHDGILAGLISTAGGLLVLLVGVSATPAGRRGADRVATALRKRELRWWQCLGGTCGALFIASQGLSIGALGVAVFTVAAVSGQLVCGLAVDRAGIGPGGPKPITLWRVVGGLVAVVAVVVSVGGQAMSTRAMWLIVLPAVAGFGLAWQSAVNGLVKQAADNTFVATAVNFTMATAALLVAGVVDVLVKGLPVALPHEWWLYVGGLLGIFVIAGSVFVVKVIGVLLLGMSMVAGQLVGAVLLDAFVPTAGATLTSASVLGTVITLVAVVVAAIPARSERMAA
jgi:transporter family-2 protein